MINSLTARIFAIFWFTLATGANAGADGAQARLRQMTSLLDSEQRQG